MEESKSQKNAFDITPLIKSTYNKIAEWHNENPTSSGLQHLSFELVSDIIEESYRHLDLKIGFDLDVDDETREKLNKEKEQKNRRVGVNDMSNLSDEDLIREIMKRKNTSESN